jgi:hypothetical protein
VRYIDCRKVRWDQRECEFSRPGEAWGLKQAVGVMGEVQLGAKPDDMEENDMVVLTRN